MKIVKQINKKKVNFILNNIRATGRVCVVNDMGEILSELPDTFEKYFYESRHFDDNFFKYIIINEATIILSINQYTLSDFKRMLNKKGKLIIIEKNKNSLLNNVGVDVKDFTNKLKNVFRKVECRYLGIPYFSKYVGWVCKI